MIGYLASFAFYRDHDMRQLRSRLYGAPLFGDSGAFTAHTLGTELRVQDYARWCWTWHRELEVYANLDVMADPAGSWANYEAMSGTGLHPLPVVHAGTDLDELRRYLDAGHDYVALGGLVTTDGKAADTWRWIDQAFTVAGDRAVFHGFGFVRQVGLGRWPWYSVDASSWGAGHRYGQGKLFTGHRLRTIDLRNPRTVAQHADAIRRQGGNLDRFLQGTWHWKDALDLNAVAYARLADWWHSRVHDVRRPSTPAAPVGPILYLADAMPQLLARAAFAIDRWTRTAA